MKKKRSSVAEAAPAKVTVKIPADLYAEIEQLMPYFADDAVVKATGRLTKALALRLTLLRGIGAVRRDARDKERGGAAT
jgi:hypothetical protein